MPSEIKRLLGKIPGANWLRMRIASRLAWRDFSGSADYWEKRYQSGGNSGRGSYGRLAELKARVLNHFVKTHEIASVIEFGCGDGNQLRLAAYPAYVGLDVAPKAISLCKEIFPNDHTKSFYLYDSRCFVDNAGLFKADLALSLDVLYHLVEDDVFDSYMRHLFEAARKYVIIYSSNEEQATHSPAERHRKFTDHVAREFPRWSLLEEIRNKFPFSQGSDPLGSPSDFYIYQRAKED